MKTFDFPKFYLVNNNYNADFAPAMNEGFQKYAQEFKRLNRIADSSGDKVKIRILSIDNQRDFNFPSGSLYVSGRSGQGAMDAQRNFVEFIYRYLGSITDIISTLDTHFLYQIFFPPCHIDEQGEFPAPHTIISSDDYKSGKYRANPDIAEELKLNPKALQKQFIYYMEQLENTGKYQLMIWPYHCLLGSIGHALSGVIEEAIRFHSLVRGSLNRFEIKGSSPYTEHYSIFSPEVKTFFEGTPLPGCGTNTSLIKTLISSDVVIIVGEASSHCVKESIQDFLANIKSQDEELLKKVYIMKDCMAPVVIPGIADFTDEAEKAFSQFESEGMHVVDSTTPIEDWPDIKLG